MNNKKILVVILIITVGCITSACTLFERQANIPDTDFKPSISPKEFKLEEFDGTLSDLLIFDTNATCTLETTTPSSSAKGTVYLAKKQARTDITSTYGNNSVAITHSISKGNTTYIWTDNKPQGIKVTTQVDQANEENIPIEESNAQANELNELQKKYHYKCSPWIVDLNKFELPPDVTFVELQDVLDKINENIDSLCNVCESAPDQQSMDDCKNKIGCNN